MIRRSIRPVLVALLALCGFRAAPRPKAAAPPPGARTPELRIEGPFAFQNLALYVVRGRTTDPRGFLTLEEGLSAGTVVVREKGADRGRDEAQVNALEIENRSGKWLYLQAGDVVEGGKQDRTIAIDVTLAPGSGPQSIDALCVERGRWTASREEGLRFKASGTVVGGNALKESIQGGLGQSRVWAEVARREARAVQAMAAADPSHPLQRSPTGSYGELAGNEQLRARREDYRKRLLPALRKYGDAVGMVVAINGKPTAGDLYASASLFRKLSAKLLDSYALDALMLRDPDGQSPPAAPAAKAAAFLSETPGPAKEDDVAPTMTRRIRTAEDRTLFEYVDRAPGAPKASPIHTSYVAKEER
jgi:hypothetical protein